MTLDLALYTVAGTALAASLPALRARLELSRAKHRSLAGHARMARRVARLVPYYGFEDERFFAADDAPPEIAARRQAAFRALSGVYESRFARSAALTADVLDDLPDLAFTSGYRVPYPFSAYVRRHLRSGAFLQGSSGVQVTDLDGNAFYDLTGSYGVNVMGYDFYKSCMDAAAAKVRDLGPVLGAYHPVVADNVRRLKTVSGLDSVSFHMSGTEAVMQAVRLARYHTRRTHLVRFCGAYHGWWGDVQPGVGNPIPARETYTLKDVDERSLRVLAKRRDIACVLVNPLQGLHPNSGAPSDSSLVDSGRRAGFDRDAYTRWLVRLREVCTARGIPLIFDEIFTGFRLAPGGAQEYFGVHADMVTYGKTLAGGYPVGVLCGRRDLMKRFRDDRPADICFARGTFNSHPHVMAGMNEFLRRFDTPAVRALYADLDPAWNARAAELNGRLLAEALPLQVANISTIWTTLYTRPSRYNWMLQFYLRAAGLALSWVGTGRYIFSLNYTEKDWQEVAKRFLAAARQMEADGWWWTPPTASNKAIRRRVMLEMLGHRR